MKIKAAAIVLMALCTGLAIRSLWVFWTPRCNEACAAHTVLGMYGLLGASAVVTVAIIALVATSRLSAKRGLAGYVVVLSALAACAMALTP